ncbi:hypothetical protein OSB04_014843 [Centaurea solstitialis]|uniref:Protein kinase domain-containing protein n=1 Tax=Centaurea solstitialis TaxID=347529 RepID=A0AA38SY09_9ASTR|nr:hypothetical protein OSB04_014843 [Centaurea solstitialis]
MDVMESEPSSSNSLQESQPCRPFVFPEIQQATNDFDESLIIGRGGFGKVYKGNITNGSSVVVAAIKRLDTMSNQGATEFWAEVEMLSKLRHCNLVSLFGYCNYEKEMILVYEYMPNGTLEDHLHKLGTPLSWLQRLNICVGAARGLHYLHTGTGIDIGVIHRDVKSSNILLNESWAAKISDFGLSKVGPTNQPSTYVNTLVKGTFGYLDPDYYETGKLTRKSDVYALGVVLLEVLCRKPAVDRSDEEQWLNLARWAQETIKEGNLKHIIDPDIRGQISPKCLKEFVRIIKRCLHNNPQQRSTMAGVLVSLESVLTIQEKFNNSLELAGKTIFGRMADMIPFPSKIENSGISNSFRIFLCIFFKILHIDWTRPGTTKPDLWLSPHAHRLACLLPGPESTRRPAQSLGIAEVLLPWFEPETNGYHPLSPSLLPLELHLFDMAFTSNLPFARNTFCSLNILKKILQQLHVKGVKSEKEEGRRRIY